MKKNKKKIQIDPGDTKNGTIQDTMIGDRANFYHDFLWVRGDSFTWVKRGRF